MKQFFSLLHLFLFLCPLLTVAEENTIDLHFCFGNSNQLVAEGRILEKHEHSPSKESDGFVENFWRTLRLLINDEEEYAKVDLVIDGRYFSQLADEEGYFRFEVLLKDERVDSIKKLLLKSEGAEMDVGCSLFLPTSKKRIAIISDFDDTVIVSDVTDKPKLLVNLFTKNIIQREIVNGMNEFYKKTLAVDDNDSTVPLFFVTGSPRQIQPMIEEFLDYHGFPSRIVFTKKLNGDDNDPLLDQFRYKANKIETIIKMLPEIKFVLVGDDGEQDPEVYDYFQQRYPDQVDSVFIRQVVKDKPRQRFEGQTLFVDNPGN